MGCWRSRLSRGGTRIERPRPAASGSNSIARRTQRSGLAQLHAALDEFLIVRRVEIEQRPARGKVLSESQADHVGGCNGQRRGGHHANGAAGYRHALDQARHSDPGAGRNHRSRETCDQRLAAVLGERNVVDLRQPSQHLNLQAGYGGEISDRDRQKPRRPRPQGEALDQLPCIGPAFVKRRIFNRPHWRSATRPCGLRTPPRFGHGLRDRIGMGADPVRYVRLDRLGQLLLHRYAARLTPTNPSTSSAIAAISRAAWPFQLMRLGVAPQSAASGYATRLVISLLRTGYPASTNSARICLAMTESRVVWVRTQRKVGRLPPAPSISELRVSNMRSMSSGDALTGTRRKSAAAMPASVAWERNPGVSIMMGRPLAPRFCAVFHASAVASSTTGTPPRARSRFARRAIERCGSASMTVGSRPVRCQ